MRKGTVGAVLAVAATGGMRMESDRGATWRCELPPETVTGQCVGRAVARLSAMPSKAATTPSAAA